ncbi:MAG: helix-turn-helix domain containing protein [Phaeodactylibacter sp.]|nr:helix-turn-helix domain containing protein [Phaeodactylibacter sp.]
MISEKALNPRGLKRAAALLELDNGKTYKEVSEMIDVSSVTVSSWARKYKKTGLDFLKDKPRPGRPKDITSRQRAKIVALAKSKPPEGHEKWSLRLLAEKAVALGLVDSISHQYINQILKDDELSIY